MKRLFCLTAAMLTGAIIGAPASAQGGSDTFIGPSPIVGSWSFRTVPYRQDTCVMSGNMSIRPTNNSEVFSCSFTAVEDCQDHFALNVVSKELMTGSLVSAVTAAVEFRRDADNVS